MRCAQCYWAKVRPGYDCCSECLGLPESDLTYNRGEDEISIGDQPLGKLFPTLAKAWNLNLVKGDTLNVTWTVDGGVIKEVRRREGRKPWAVYFMGYSAAFAALAWLAPYLHHHLLWH